MPNQALEQTRDSVLRYGESIGCELLIAIVSRTEDPNALPEMRRYPYETLEWRAHLRTG